jgi:2-dehydro-3-deoxyglucarate aldolase
VKNNSLKQKLQSNKLTVGSWVTIGHPSVVEILSNAGFDWLTIDMEHTSIDYSMAQVLISTVQSSKMAALVRVAKNEEVIIKKVLDAGADGIIVPSINSAKDARQAVAFTQYPPLGKRGVGLYRAQKYGNGFEQYKEWLSKSVVVIAQIEHFEAINNIEEIVKTEGIDGVIIGPYDLSGSYGLPGDFEHPEFLSAIEKYETACRENNKIMGFHVIEPRWDQLKMKISDGYKFLAFSTDFLFMGRMAQNEMKSLKEVQNK